MLCQDKVSACLPAQGITGTTSTRTVPIMRRLIPLCFAATLFSACQHYDKAAHFAAGAAVSHIVATETGSKAAGCAAAFGVGLLKELIDDHADPADLIATGLGCAVLAEF